MANVNFQFGADASKVDRAIEGLSKKLDGIILKGTQSEDVLSRAFTDTAVKAEQLKVKVDSISSAFQRMQAQTQLNNLQANLNTGVIDRFITQMNQAGTTTQRTTTQVMQMAQAVGLSRNQLSQIVSAYGAYAASLRIGSEEQINAAANLKILQQTFSELDQSISVSGQNMRSQINNTEAGIRSMSANLNMIPQQIQESMGNFSLSPTISQAKAKFDELKLKSDGTTESLVSDIIEVKDTYGISFDQMLRHGIVDLEQLKAVSAHINSQIRDMRMRNVLSGPESPEIGRFYNNMMRMITPYRDELNSVVQQADTTMKKLQGVYALLDNDAPVGKNNPFTQVIAEQKLSVNELQVLLNRLQQTFNNLRPDSASFDRYRMAIDAVNGQLNQTTHGTMGGTLALQQLGFAVGDASQLMTNWRGALMGIGNNLPFIIQGIMQLQMEVRALNASGAVQTTVWKQLSSSLAGPAGILLGINALVLAMQVLPEIFSKVSVSASATTKSLKSTKDILKELTSATKASVLMGDESVRSTLAEGLAFKDLTTKLVNTTAGSKERKVVVDQIQAGYPAYIKNIDLNTASEKELKKWVEKSTAALYGKIKAMMLDKLMDKNYEAVIEAQTAYKKSLEDEKTVAKQRSKSDVAETDPRKDPNARSEGYLYDAEGNIIGEASTKTTKQRSKDNTAKAKVELEKVTKKAKEGGVLITQIVDDTMLFLGLDPALANTDPDALKDMNKDLTGDKPEKQDEYTTLEQLRNKYAKLIAMEKDSFKILELKVKLNNEEYDLIQKTGKTQEEKDNAEIDYLNTKNDLEKERTDLLDDRLNKELQIQKNRLSRDAKRSEEFSELFQNIELANNEGMVKLSKIISDTNALGLDEWSQQIYELDQELLSEKNSIMNDELLANELKMELITANESKYAKKRAKIEKSLADQKYDIVSNMFGAMSSIFAEHTAAYAIFAAAQATMDTWKAANIALANPLGAPWNYIDMAAVIATGLGNVAQIYEAATATTAFAKGGLVSNPTVGLVGEDGPELIAPQRDFMYYSQQLLASAGNSNDSELSVTVKGNDLVFMLQKATKKVNRQKIGGKV